MSSIPGIPGELVDLYQKYFGKNPVVVIPPPDNSSSSQLSIPSNTNSGYPLYSPKGAVLAELFLNTEIWLPITFKGLPSTITNAKNGNIGEWYLPYATVNVSGRAAWIETPLNQRKGTVKELYSLDDYKILIKGFLIDKQTRTFPEAEVSYLKKCYELGTAFRVDNAITNIYLEDSSLPPDQQYRVVLKDFDMPEVIGGKKSMRPFTMELSSDFIFTLTLA